MGIFDKFKNKKDGDSTDDKKLEVTPASVKPASSKKAKTATTKSESKVKAELESKGVKNEEAKPISEAKSGEDLFGILVRPIVTEKSSMLGQLNQYSFLVSDNANKIQIMKAIKDKYGVEPVRVNILNKSGKYLRYGKTYGRTRSTKKAVVFLPEGKSITIYEGV